MPAVDAAATEAQPDVLLTCGDPSTDAFNCEICNFVMLVGYANATHEMYRDYDADEHPTKLKGAILKDSHKRANERKRKTNRQHN